jgi:alpha-beta hydrolase superfamily lysophospholipase
VLLPVLKIIGIILLSVAALFLAILIYLGIDANDMAELENWHKVPEWNDDITEAGYEDFGEYLKTEKKLVDDIYKSVLVKNSDSYNKYMPGNPSSPITNGENLNSSFEFGPVEKSIQGGILLVHGLTDSPYHLRAIGQIFADSGYYVIGLRLPGHGTVPGALLDVCWEDWYAAVHFGARMVLNKIENIKNSRFYIGGFSTGGALTLRYVLDAVVEDTKVPDKLLLLSPAIGVNPLAELMDWHHIISWISCFEKFKWLEIKPEYDPFKYNSFAKNAADQIFDLTEANWKLIESVAAEEKLHEKLPPIYAFQSQVDATVQTEELIAMFENIAPAESELVLFDVNHDFDVVIDEALQLESANSDYMKNMKATVLLVTNEMNSVKTEDKGGLIIKSLSYQSENTRRSLEDSAMLQNLAWPENVFALSHVCIPIHPDDPAYGKYSILGSINLKGEHKVLVIGDDLTRLRYNPFFRIIRASLETSFIN